MGGALVQVLRTDKRHGITITNWILPSSSTSEKVRMPKKGDTKPGGRDHHPPPPARYCAMTIAIGAVVGIIGGRKKGDEREARLSISQQPHKEERLMRA